MPEITHALGRAGDGDREIGNVEAALRAGASAVAAEGRITDLANPDNPEEIPTPIAVLPQGLRIEDLGAILTKAEERADAPRARRGTAKLLELDSFIAHVKRFADSDSAVFADTVSTTLTAVLDYHRAGAEGSPRWGRHRAVYTCPLSEQWRAWIAKDGQPFAQDAFADWIEERMRDLCPPPKESDLAQPAKLVEIGRQLRIHARSTFEREVNPTTGESSLVAKTEHEKTSTRLPRGFLLLIPIFDAGRAVQVEARMRFALRDGRPTFTYALVDAPHLLRTGFAEVRSAVAEATGLPIYAGTPES